MSDELNELKVVNKLNRKLKFLSRKNKFLTPKLCRMLCNVLIQPHFEYAYTFGTKIDLAKFRSINWLPTNKIVHQCINATTFRFVSKTYPFHLNEIFEFALHCRIDRRNNFASLSTLLTSITQNRKPYRTLVSLCGAIYPKPFKKPE